MHKALGKGLETLIPNLTLRATMSKESITSIPIDKIRVNKYQPRLSFNDEKLQELAESIKKHGLAQPILVSPAATPGEYDLVAGERRLRACRKANLKEILAVIRPTTDKEKFQLSLIENLHRDDLNSIEEAMAYERIMKEFSLTQEELAASLGMSRSKIANTLRLLSLPDYIQDGIKDGALSPGHARALIILDDPERQKKLALRIIQEKLTTREVERIVQTWKQAITSGKVKLRGKKSPEAMEIENQLQRILGTKIIIKNRGKKGWISIAYYSLDHFDSIIATLKGRFKNS